MGKEKVEEMVAGDICAISGIDGFDIGDTIADFETPEGMTPISIDEPTMSMFFTINTSPFFGISFDSADTVYAELWSMNKANYDYFSALFTNLNQSPFSAAPADPPSNIENGIGYFGAFMVDTVSIIIP